jgi:hypothetical protein
VPGPPPNPNAVRRNPRVGVVILPAGGRTGRTPKWPLPDDPRLTARINIEADLIEELEQKELDEDGLSRTEATKLTRAKQRLAIAEATRDAILETEKRLWRDLWRTPQAAQWERLKWTNEVAQYVRHKSAAECGNLEESREARLRAKDLGLTPKGMKDLMWVIADDEVKAARAAKTADTKATERRKRFKAVDTGS